MSKIGFLINPIAGMGGRVGLKGTDGVVEQAKELGAQPTAHLKAGETLHALRRLLEHWHRTVNLVGGGVVAGEADDRDRQEADNCRLRTRRRAARP